MARSGGEKTRARILEVAEKLFAENGFDATSVDSIARAAGVNKALIYYHYKDKADLVTSLFAQIIEDIERATADGSDGDRPATDLKADIRTELDLLERHQPIVAVMLGEALKTGRRGDTLFECADYGIEQEQGVSRLRGRPRRLQLVHEFFTGFIPLIAFVALRERFCEHYRIAPDEARDLFVEAFFRSHGQSHVS
jgi:AcrR family transcriptional regulator